MGAILCHATETNSLRAIGSGPYLVQGPELTDHCPVPAGFIWVMSWASGLQPQPSAETYPEMTLLSRASLTGIRR